MGIKRGQKCQDSRAKLNPNARLVGEKIGKTFRNLKPKLHRVLHEDEQLPGISSTEAALDPGASQQLGACQAPPGTPARSTKVVPLPGSGLALPSYCAHQSAWRSKPEAALVYGAHLSKPALIFTSPSDLRLILASLTNFLVFIVVYSSLKFSFQPPGFVSRAPFAVG